MPICFEHFRLLSVCRNEFDGLFFCYYNNIMTILENLVGSWPRFCLAFASVVDLGFSDHVLTPPGPCVLIPQLPFHDPKDQGGDPIMQMPRQPFAHSPTPSG